MADVSFTITGVKKLDRKLQQLEPKLAKKVIRKALRKAAKPLQARTKALAPVGETGQVRRNVKIRASTRTRKKIIRLRVLIGKDDFTGAQFYAAFINLGTKTTGVGGKGKGGAKRKGTRRPGLEALRFMQRAKEQTESQVRRIAEDEIRKGIEQLARG